VIRSARACNVLYFGFCGIINDVNSENFVIMQAGLNAQRRPSHVLPTSGRSCATTPRDLHASDTWLMIESIELFPCKSQDYLIQVGIVNRDLSGGVTYLYEATHKIEDEYCTLFPAICIRISDRLSLDGDATSLIFQVHAWVNPREYFWTIYYLGTREPQLKRLPFNFSHVPLNLQDLLDGRCEIVRSTSHVYFSISPCGLADEPCPRRTPRNAGSTCKPISDTIINIESIRNWGNDWMSQSSTEASSLKSRILASILDRHTTASSSIQY
jgi:hypothetical protein